MRKPQEWHGHTSGRKQTPEYRVWRDMHARCTNSGSSSYRNYGARGIAVCARWAVFSAFLADIGRRPSARHSLERRDNDGGYGPSNCFWATRKEQARNRRTSRLLTLGAQTFTVSEWSERLNLSKDVIRKRLRMHWPVERALTAPVDARYQR